MDRLLVLMVIACTDTIHQVGVTYTATSYIHQVGAAAEAGVQRKHKKYSGIKSSGMDLVAVAIETAGVICEKGKE